MEAMPSHRSHVERSLAVLSDRSRLLFGLLATERMRGCCFVACREDGGWEIFASTVERLYELLAREGPLDRELLKPFLTAVDEAVPEDGSPLETQGQSALISLVGTLWTASGEAGEAYLIVNSVVDALDNYTYHVLTTLTQEKDFREGYPLLERELRRQLDDLEFVAQIDGLSSAAIRERRIENLQYAVPVAVG